jgi:oxepin-CoA hydrolase/3-oxo-5,6-dehydrosuberyl-CoA semialdehyde dehydrogenase
MKKLGNYVLGRWESGEGDGQPLYNATTGDPVFSASTKGLNFADILDYARKVGNPALRKMSFQERGRMLKALALYLTERKEEFYQISYLTGATRADGWIDIEGGFGNLFSYAVIKKEIPRLAICDRRRAA